MVDNDRINELEIDSRLDLDSRIIISDAKEIIFLLNYYLAKGYSILIDLFAVDYPAKYQRIEIVYSLLNVVENKRVYIKIYTDLDVSVPSVTSVFSSANWLEREIFDMYGIIFTNHPNLERILTDYDFQGHPMLKDFPLTGYKEVRYDIESKSVVYEDVNLSQEFRVFDCLTPWQGTEYSTESEHKK